MGVHTSSIHLAKNIFNFINDAAVVMAVGFELRKFFEQSSLFV